MKRAFERRRIVPGGARIFQRMYTRIGCEGRPPRFMVEYHPYADLTHTIRVREDTAYIRISDVLRSAPRLVLEATAAILLGRLFRKRPPKALLRTYREFSYAPPTRRRLLALRQERAHRLEHHPAGIYHDLGPMFDRLNRRYFRSELKRPRLGWSPRAWRTQLGCFDPALDQIVINCQLDRQRVPEYVVAYVLYHEMLHLKHPMKFARCRRESHSPQFRKAEKKFAEYERAMKFLERFPAY